MQELKFTRARYIGKRWQVFLLPLIAKAKAKCMASDIAEEMLALKPASIVFKKLQNEPVKFYPNQADV
ncbi:conserved hypothetical protein [Ricinus communis]|uniref:Uncharacterized protein n=1 Tax=Ricinus communis TaxID=3988 RepID=B9T486_RICCO|nr:conserved hypothetical protein [Ricinus communis]